MADPLRSLAHCLESGRIGKQRLELGRETAAVAFWVRYVHGGADPDQGLGVLGLMVTGSARAAAREWQALRR